MLLSGGIDSMLVAQLLVNHDLDPYAVTFTATVDGTPLGTDMTVAAACAEHLNIDHRIVTVTPTDLTDLTRTVITDLNTTDIWEVAAAIPLRACANELRTAGITGAWWTGTGADALTAGGTHPHGDPHTWVDQNVRTRVQGFTRHRFIPDFYERTLGDDADRLINTFQTIDATRQLTRFTPEILWVDGHDKMPLRAAAINAGLPEHLALHPKARLQESSGLFDAFTHLARQAVAHTSAGYTDPMTEPADMVAARLLLTVMQATPTTGP